jgi:Na+-translocating ferredoxin:NAD+ oxidoreductase RnfD subunit
MLRKAQRFFKTPKGLLLLILLGLIAISAPGQGVRMVLVGLGSASAAAGLTDLIILRFRKKVWEFPSGAVLSALIIGMVLRAQEPWHVVTLTAVVAVLSKYIFRSHTANLFNPAALAMVVSFYVFHTGQSWWGALVDVVPVAKLLLIAGGIYIADRVNKIPLVLAFLGSYFALFTIVTFVRNPLSVAEIFRTPDFEAALYFAFFILTDPPTSPTKYRDQLVFAGVVAVVSFAFFELLGALYFLLAGVLAGNIWEAWRRTSHRRKRLSAKLEPQSVTATSG